MEVSFKNKPQVMKPKLSAAVRVLNEATQSGFEWQHPIKDAQDSFMKEVAELNQAVKNGDIQAIEEELGDVAFNLADIARVNGIDPDIAVVKSMIKFQRRFNIMKKLARGNLNRPCQELSELWKQAKAIERQTKE